MDLITILEKTVSPDKAELETALNFLNQAAQQNLPVLLKQLSEVLKHGGNSTVARMQSGLQLKNKLYSKDPNIRAQYQCRWLQFPDEIRQIIKKNVLDTLGTETLRPSSAAQCVAYIACAELPAGSWTDVITILTQNVTSPDATEMSKESSLETIGYICQDIDPEILTTQSNVILTAIINGMKKEEPSDHVKLAATTALLNSLEFTRANFENESERHIIMQVVCEATQSSHTHVRVASLQCLVKIMSLYYQFMEFYMGPALFAITMEAMKSDVDDVALQGIEFWSNVCDEEVDLAIELSEAQEQGRPPEKSSRFYAKGALQYLVPILTKTLTKQEDFDDDEWNPSKAASVCLMLMASCCEDDIVHHVLPFVTEHINSTDWKHKEAAVMAFGSIIEGPDTNNLKPLVEQAMPMLIDLLKDSSSAVRDTAAWTVGRICEILPDGVINDQYLNPLLHALVEGLNAEPRVAANMCWAFSSLAEAAFEASEETTNGNDPETYCLSSYFEPIVQKLLETTDRVDGSQHNLRSAAYEALMELIKNSPRDCYVTVQKTTVVILERLHGVLKMEEHIQSTSDRVQYNDLQSLLCATLQSVLRKVAPEDAAKISDPVMTALLQMFNSSSGKSGGVQEDALLAVSVLIEVLGQGFAQYMEAFKPFLELGLKNHEEYQVCLAAVGATGDICRSLGRKVLPYCDEIMMMLLSNLGNDAVHRSVKPQILNVFGDVALAIGTDFTKYLAIVLSTLRQASQAQVDKNAYDMLDYLNELREACLAAYTGIIQGIKGEGDSPNRELSMLQEHVEYITSFVEQISNDDECADGVICACCGLIGDLCSAFGAGLLPLLEKESISSLLTRGRRGKTLKTKQLATWATREVRKLKGSATSS